MPKLTSDTCTEIDVYDDHDEKDWLAVIISAWQTRLLFVNHN